MSSSGHVGVGARRGRLSAVDSIKLSPLSLSRTAMAALRIDARFVFVHLMRPISSPHHHGWAFASYEYIEHVKMADEGTARAPVGDGLAKPPRNPEALRWSWRST